MEIHKLFYSPVGISKLGKDPSFYEKLSSLIDEEQKASKGVKISNAGGWQSRKELFEKEEPIVTEFKNAIMELFCEFLNEVYEGSEFQPIDLEMESWANVNYTGNTNNSHDHTVNDNHWSGILYVEPGFESHGEPTGKTVFEDRQISGDGRMIGSVPMADKGEIVSEFSSRPERGKVVFFPGALWHRVDLYKGKERRITIAYNFKVRGLTNFMFDQQNQASKTMTYLWINFRGFMVIGSRIKRALGF